MVNGHFKYFHQLGLAGEEFINAIGKHSGGNVEAALDVGGSGSVDELEDVRNEVIPLVLSGLFAKDRPTYFSNGIGQLVPDGLALFGQQ